MDYQWLRAFHIIGVVTWFAGLFYIFRLYVYHVENHGKPEVTALLQVMERRLYRGICWPSMLFTATFGLMLFAQMSGHYLAQPWFQMKLLGLAILFGYHFYAGKVRKDLAAAARKHPDLAAALSRLSWLECRVGPMKGNDSATLAAFDACFARTDLVWVELTRDVVELAAAIRVQTGLKTPDALQAASCLQLGGEHLFLTGDSAFRRVAGLNVKVLT